MTGIALRSAIAITNAIILIAISAQPQSARAQNDAKNRVTPSSTPSSTPAAKSCPAPEALTAAQLHGEWQVAWEAPADPGSAAPARETLRFGSNPNHADSLSGELQRGNALLQLAGDLEEGELSLEESSDGKTISASWLGRVQTGSCGQEIRGAWTADAALTLSAGQTRRRMFVLRRLVGW
jgi:hypothetical protein